MSIKSVIKSEPGKSIEEVKSRRILQQSECQPVLLSPWSVIAQGNLGILSIWEGFPGAGWEGSGARGGRKPVWAPLEVNNTKNSTRAEWKSRVLGADKAYHLLFIPHRYLVGILCEESETNTQEPVYPFILKALFFSSLHPPVSSWLPLKLPCILEVNAAMKLPGAANNISTCFSRQMCRDVERSPSVSAG